MSDLINLVTSTRKILSNMDLKQGLHFLTNFSAKLPEIFCSIIYNFVKQKDFANFAEISLIRIKSNYHFHEQVRESP